MMYPNDVVLTRERERKCHALTSPSATSICQVTYPLAKYNQTHMPVLLPLIQCHPQADLATEELEIEETPRHSPAVWRWQCYMQ